MKLFPVGIYLALATVAPAQLSWERTSVELFASVGQESIVAEFPFTNRTAAAIEVQDLRSSCGCTVPMLEKKVYAPGESGVVKARFEIESRQGQQDKSVYVQTDAGATELRFVVHVPTRVEITPRLLAFAGAGAETKTVRLSFRADAPVQEVALASAAGPFEVQVVEREHGRVYELHVTPRDAAAANVTGAIVVRSKGASGAEHFDTIFLRRRP